MPVFGLSQDIYFPPPHLANDDGLLAVGGDLSVERLLLAYRYGIFPWYNASEPILWWCPHERFVIRPDRVHTSHSLKKYMRKHTIKIRINRDFADTIHRCRALRESTVGTWINDDMENAYIKLHRHGYATAVEAYVDGGLAGGLYGVNIGRCFFGESMFSEQMNGSKIALVLFAQFLAEREFVMIDCQFRTDHLASMGGESISYEEYDQLLVLGDVRSDYRTWDEMA